LIPDMPRTPGRQQPRTLGASLLLDLFHPSSFWLISRLVQVTGQHSEPFHAPD
jgi:hypothetical protein